jgi:cyclic-di-AMP phosphodiesterase PgpH
MTRREEADRSDGDPPPGAVEAVRQGPRVALAVALTLLTFALFPTTPAANFPIYEVGSVASENVIAPFAFRVLKDTTELARERDALARTVEPVYVFVPPALDSAQAQLRAFSAALDSAYARRRRGPASVQATASAFGVVLTGAQVAYLADSGRRAQLIGAVGRAYRRWLSAGVAAAGAFDGVSGDVLVRRGESEHTQPSDSLRTSAEFLVQAQALRPETSGPAARSAYDVILQAFFHPTIVPDSALTAMRRDQLRRSVPVSEFDVRAGEKIVGANEVIGVAQHEKLLALHEVMAQRRATVSGLRRGAGALLFDALVVALLGITVLIFRPHVYASWRAMVVTAGVTALVLVGGALVGHVHPLHPELIPVGIAAVVISALFDRRIAMIVAVLLAVLLGGQAVFRGTNALYLNIIGGAGAAYSVRAVRNRQQTYWWILVIAAAYAAAAVAVGLSRDLPGAAIAASSGFGALNAVISVVVALLLLPLAERYTGIETDLTLLEWSDLNRPLMQRLSLEAPGTFAHSLQIANVAEAGCRAVGANALLARVGAYYHDIGKLAKPQYFVENQARGRNPHDELTPLQSAQIIRNHVREGLQLAEEYGVPQVLRAFIAEHHGTGTISYFLERARGQGDDVRVDDYRYAGPIPQSAETAILMLADGAEAAVRVLDEPTAPRIREVVEHMVRLRLDQGQLRATPLTLSQLEMVKDEFARVLSGVHHGRIDYPASSGGVGAGFGAR